MKKYIIQNYTTKIINPNGTDVLNVRGECYFIIKYNIQYTSVTLVQNI